MADVVLSEKLLADLAGWEVIKQARTIVAEDRVLSSCWQPPTLRGVVQSGPTTYRAGLIIHRSNDAENLCTCRQAREWGTFCPHSIAVGLHFLKPPAAPTPPPKPGATARPGSPVAAAKSPGTPTRAAATKEARRIQRADENTEGEALTLHVVLPPALPESLQRGQLTVFFEGHWRKGRVPLASLPLDEAFVLAPEDQRLLDAAELLAGGDTPALLQVASTDFATLLEALRDHPRVTLGKATRVTISDAPWRPPLSAKLQPTGEIVLQLRPLPKPPVVVPGQRLWICSGAELRPLGLPPECLPVLSGQLKIPRPQVPEFLLRSWMPLQAAADLQADFDPADFELLPVLPKFHLHLAGGLAALTAHLQCAYGPRVMTPGVSSTDEAVWVPDPQFPKRYSSRSLESERAALQRLLAAGFSSPDRQGRMQLTGQNPVLNFFARDYARLQREWQVTLEERLDRSTQQHLERIEPRFAVQPSGEQWFDLQVSFQTSGGETVSTAEIQRLLRGGGNSVRLKNGKTALIDTGAVEELEQILVDCSPDQQNGAYRMSQAQAGFLHASLAQQGWQPVAPTAWRERTLQQTGDASLTCPPLGALDSVLRPYQKHGVAWLQFLRRNGFGGVLADEMGLGKTLQTLAHLQALKAASRPAGGSAAAASSSPHLVVCPTSLVFNWVAEAAQFTPGLRVLALHGPQRHALFAQIPQADLIVTSYALIRRDLERYRALSFDTVILDEAQHIKNRQTQNALAVKAIPSRHRLVLTGTPLENSVLDLWSIFDFLMPGYLGNAQDFRDRYEVPLVKERDASVQARLARRVRPFLLRRLKREVAPELPARIDQVVWCDLSESQAGVYQQLLNATRKEVLDAVGAQGLAKSRMLVLTALLRLRQACCDLRLLQLEPASTTDTADAPPASASPIAGSTETSPPDLSGKVEAFAELLEEILDGGHRVLVFSQFTKMLGLLRTRLDEEQVKYCYLDGSTRDRPAEIARFQSNGGFPVFLISLKAGGVGLNLTAADTVIHFDPWWNPAVEDQATDRAHRIGQTRVVTSYKLITRGTVEEKILLLQRKKREVIQSLLTGEEQLSEALNWDEIQELFA